MMETKIVRIPTQISVCTGDVVFQRFSSKYASNVRGLQIFDDPLEHVSVSYWFVG